MQYSHEIKNEQFNYITPIYEIKKVNNNNIYIMRDDLIPFSFGGNKARKAFNFFKDIENGGYNYVITYGSASSNHCRIISNLCKNKKIGCTIISTENEKETFNRDMCKIFDAEIVICDIDKVQITIEQQISKKNNEGYKTYFIQGGGHGNLGTQAYVDAFKNIKDFEENKNIKFDYIFHASGTGTTQAGLIIGNRLNNDNAKVIGISIARKLPYGRDVIIESINQYNRQHGLNFKDIEKDVNFIDDYILHGYGTYNSDIEMTIFNMLKDEGIPLDPTYTGKAFWGMKEYIIKNNIEEKNILFIHTGGTPLFFDNLKD